MSVSGKRVSLVSLSVLLLVSVIASAFPAKNVSAAQITQRSLTLQAGPTDGGSKPGGMVHHLFNFTLPTGGSVGSISFQYCKTATGSTCDLPDGLDTTQATYGSETGATGFSLVNTTNGAPYITRSPSTVSGGQAVSYQLLNVKNPTTTNQTFFVRIATYTSTDATGTPIDTGSVTASTANEITLTGIMPESLIFCTGAAITANTDGIPDCSTATSGDIKFNQLFSPTDTATATSQMAASTNATTGYTITVAGPTLTSGSNTIPAMGTAAAGSRGKSQFGLNLKANTTATSTPAVGSEIAPVSNGTDLRALAATGYDAVDTFKFNSGDSVANSNSNSLPSGPTNSQIYTASYIVNVSGSQPAGTYVTTLTYVCTASF